MIAAGSRETKLGTSQQKKKGVLQARAMFETGSERQSGAPQGRFGTVVMAGVPKRHCRLQMVEVLLKVSCLARRLQQQIICGRRGTRKEGGLRFEPYFYLAGCCTSWPGMPRSLIAMSRTVALSGAVRVMDRPREAGMRPKV